MGVFILEGSLFFCQDFLKICKKSKNRFKKLGFGTKKMFKPENSVKLIFGK